jgi:hypothetical protein
MISAGKEFATPGPDDRPATDEAITPRVRAEVLPKHDSSSATTAITAINTESPAHKEVFAGLWLGEGEAMDSAAA